MAKYLTNIHKNQYPKGEAGPKRRLITGGLQISHGERSEQPNK